MRIYAFALKWTANLSSFFNFYSSFYLTESGHWYWLAFLPQSVNNDLAAADVGPRCQACDKHSCRSHIATWLSYFYWLPLKYRFDFKVFFISHTAPWSGADIAFNETLSPRVAWWMKSKLKKVFIYDLLPRGKVLIEFWMILYLSIFIYCGKTANMLT